MRVDLSHNVIASNKGLTISMISGEYLVEWKTGYQWFKTLEDAKQFIQSI